MLDFNKQSILKEVANAIRVHNHTHKLCERNAVLISEYLDFAADLVDKLAEGNITIVQHGHWIAAKSTSSSKCSVCMKYATHETPYCPYCGAKLEWSVDSV